MVLDAAEPHPQLPLRVLELAFELPHEDVPQVEVLREVLQPQPLDSRRGGKNSSTGKSKRENTSQGSSERSPPIFSQQSFSGIQISNAGISSWISRSSLMIEN